MKSLYIGAFIPLFISAMVFAAPVSFAKSDPGNGNAFGHFIAPGWLKKNGAPASEGVSLPPGVDKKMSKEDDEEPDDTADPVISDLEATSTDTTVAVSWDTDEPAEHTVYLSTISPVDTEATGTLSVSDASLDTVHEATFDSLTPSTTYFALVEVTDEHGNTSTSSEVMVSTDEAQDITAPSITNIVVDATHASATLSWDTNEDADSAAYISTTTPVDPSTSDTIVVEDTTLTMDHALEVTGLDASTTYHALVFSTDDSGNTATSSEVSFTTNSEPDTSGPVISDVTLDPATSTIDVSWMTDEPATSRVYYSTSTGFTLGDTGVTVVGDTSLVTSHDLLLSALTASTTYYLRIESDDATDNTTLSDEMSTTTTSS